MSRPPTHVGTPSSQCGQLGTRAGSGTVVRNPYRCHTRSAGPRGPLRVGQVERLHPDGLHVAGVSGRIEAVLENVETERRAEAVVRQFDAEDGPAEALDESKDAVTGAQARPHEDAAGRRLV